MFVWAKARVEAQKLAQALWAQGILVTPGYVFFPDEVRTRYLRFNVAACSQESSMRKLGAVHTALVRAQRGLKA